MRRCLPPSSFAACVAWTPSLLARTSAEPSVCWPRLCSAPATCRPNRGCSASDMRKRTISHPLDRCPCGGAAQLPGQHIRRPQHLLCSCNAPAKPRAAFSVPRHTPVRNKLSPADRRPASPGPPASAPPRLLTPASDLHPTSRPNRGRTRDCSPRCIGRTSSHPFVPNLLVSSPLVSILALSATMTSPSGTHTPTPRPPAQLLPAWPGPPASLPAYRLTPVPATSQPNRVRFYPSPNTLSTSVKGISSHPFDRRPCGLVPQLPGQHVC